MLSTSILCMIRAILSSECIRCHSLHCPRPECCKYINFLLPWYESVSRWCWFMHNGGLYMMDPWQVHGAFAGFSGITVGICNSHYVCLPIPEVTAPLRKLLIRLAGCGTGAWLPPASRTSVDSPNTSIFQFKKFVFALLALAICVCIYINQTYSSYIQFLKIIAK